MGRRNQGFTGSVFVEFALVLPVLMLLAWGTISVTMMAVIHYRTSVAAHEVAMAVFRACGGLIGAAQTTMESASNCVARVMSEENRRAVLQATLIPLPSTPPSTFPQPTDHPGELWQPINVRFFRCPTYRCTVSSNPSAPICSPSSASCVCSCASTPLTTMAALESGYDGPGELSALINQSFNSFYLGGAGIPPQIMSFRGLLNRRGVVTFATVRSSYPAWITTFGRTYAQESVMY